jgi:predicted metal-binding membrane protein
MSTSPVIRRSAFRLSPVTIGVLVLSAALVTWIVTVQRMRGMDAGPGTDLGGLGWYLGVWVTMMAAMMFPSAAPMILLFHRVSDEKAKRGQPFVPTPVFLLSYLAVWAAYGLAAYGLYRLVVVFDVGFLDWDRAGPYVAGAAIAAAGLYELTPLKSMCLRHCRSPMHFVLGHWRPGWLGAIRMGGEHGAFCVGCCWGLMIVLFALGVMSLTWMAVVAALIFAQKILPKGESLTKVFAIAFVAAGVWVAAAPASVPGLTLPDSSAADQARMRMMHMPPSEQQPMKPAGATKPGMQMREGTTTGGMGQTSSMTDRMEKSGG